MTIHQDCCMQKLTQHHSKRIHQCFELSFFLIFFLRTQNVFLFVDEHGHHLVKEGRGQRADVRPQNLSQTHRFKIVITVDYKFIH